MSPLSFSDVDNIPSHIVVSTGVDVDLHIRDGDAARLAGKLKKGRFIPASNRLVRPVSNRATSLLSVSQRRTSD